MQSLPLAFHRVIGNRALEIAKFANYKQIGNLASQQLDSKLTVCCQKQKLLGSVRRSDIHVTILSFLSNWLERAPKSLKLIPL